MELPTRIEKSFGQTFALVYGEPLVVDASWLEGNGKFDDYEEAVEALGYRSASDAANH